MHSTCSWPDHSFDAVWSVEAGPHMPDKQRYADELLRVLKPGGLLAVADWNRRDPSDGAMTKTERRVMRQLPQSMGPPRIRQHCWVSAKSRNQPIWPR
jgi:MPBQ/MSBQ methyltransferase